MSKNDRKRLKETAALLSAAALLAGSAARATLSSASASQVGRRGCPKQPALAARTAKPSRSVSFEMRARASLRALGLIAALMPALVASGGAAQAAMPERVRVRAAPDSFTRW